MTERLIKDEREAIEAIKSNMPTSGYYMLRESLEMAMQALEEVQQYRAIGTVEELREAKEKQNRRKRIIGIQNFYKCSVCDTVLRRTDKYCHECGQAIDWESEE